ncbi:tetratricopeptide repeat protein [Parabacteroides sp. OttesenSCG-928-G07]|nr:tetratricopeptide repeat protein [Parabacteroides sp. OttesenSCG-928-G21]MDL2277489.1 tetratricopeptide repeat protein [Parabacteroides sp. OttesenSCG-928-G07]
MKNLNKHLPLFLILFFLSLAACHQKLPYDEILGRIERIIDEHPDSALWILENDVNPNMLSNQQYADWCLFITQARDKNYVEHTSDSLVRHAMEYYEKHDNKDRLMMAYYYMGLISQDMQLAPRAQDYYKKALEVGRNSEDYSTRALICNNLGTLYTYQYAYDLALPYLKEAYGYYEKLNDTEGLSFVLRDIARVHHQTEQLDSALYYYQQATTYAHPNSHSSALRELAGVFIDKKEYEKAMLHIQKSIEITSDTIDLYPAYLILGNLYLETGFIDSAKYYLNKSVISPQLRTQASAYYRLSKIAELQKNWEESIRMLKKYTQIRNTIEQSDNNAAMQQVEAMYNFQQIEYEAEEYKLQGAIAERNSLWLALIAVILIAGFIIYSLYVKTQRKNFHAQKELLLQFTNRQKQNSEAQLKINTNRLSEIEQLKLRKDTPKAAVLNLEEQLINSENQRILQDIEKRKFMQKELKNQKIYNKFYYADAKIITNEDIKLLKQAINLQYPDFEARISAYDLYANKETCYLCYLLKANIKVVRIAELMNISPQAISNKRGKLNRKIRTKNMPLKSLDEVVYFLNLTTH